MHKSLSQYPEKRRKCCHIHRPLFQHVLFSPEIMKSCFSNTKLHFFNGLCSKCYQKAYAVINIDSIKRILEWNSTRSQWTRYATSIFRVGKMQNFHVTRKIFGKLMKSNSCFVHKPHTSGFSTDLQNSAGIMHQKQQKHKPKSLSEKNTMQLTKS